jgi:hypothetical protein
VIDVPPRPGDDPIVERDHSVTNFARDERRESVSPLLPFRQDAIEGSSAATSPGDGGRKIAVAPPRSRDALL